MEVGRDGESVANFTFQKGSLDPAKWSRSRRTMVDDQWSMINANADAGATSGQRMVVGGVK